MAAHAGGEEAGKQEKVESVKPDDGCTHPAQLIHQSVRLPQSA